MKWNGKKIKNDSKMISVAEAKSHFSEYSSKVAYTGERFLITKRGKPLVALVPAGDLKTIKSDEESSQLSEIIGKWKNFEDIEENVKRAYSSRKKDIKRDVSI